MSISCPYCGSQDRISNYIQVMPFDQVAYAVQTARRADQPAMAFGTLALWASVKAINRMRKKHRCTNCCTRY